MSQSASPMPPLRRNPLTLIVATTPVTSTTSTTTSTAHQQSQTRLLGIGKNGTLPWPRIKSDMSFFARVSTRVPASEPSTQPQKPTLNAIIMGRKTYYSIPPNLRPLKDRLNVVITRDTSGSVRDEIERDLARQRQKDAEKTGAPPPRREALVATGIEDALRVLEQQRSATNEHDYSVGNIFVIGGGEIYATSLGLTGPFGAGLRILMTRVKKRDSVDEFDCDTFFPLSDDDLQEDAGKWREASTAEVSQWVGEEVSPDWTDDGDVSVKMVGYERLS